MALQNYYNTGTVSLTNGSPNVTGTGTLWTTNLRANDLFTHLGVIYRISSITDDTHLVLARNFTGTTASSQAYEVYMPPPSTDITSTVRTLITTWGSFSTAVFPNGNDIGIGRTPESGWSAAVSAFAVGKGGGIYGTTATSDLNLVENVYWDGANYKYISTAAACAFFLQNNGAFSWHTAPSGTAGNNATLTQAMSLDSSKLTMNVPISATNVIAPNKIINGDMRLDQRRGGNSLTVTTPTYCVDRWYANATASSKYSVQQNAGSVAILSGMPSTYLGATSLSAYSVGVSDSFGLLHYIEGLNCTDLLWGTSNAQTVTLSFWARSSLTGTFGGALRNSGATRSYPFTYSIAAANTWTKISVTIPGDTTGTWLTSNGIGVVIAFNLGTGTTYSGPAGAWAGANYLSATGSASVVGTNGATFYLTGVKMEVGSIATPFVSDDFAVLFSRCARYYQVLPVNSVFAVGNCETTTSAYAGIKFHSAMRANPTISMPNGGSGSGQAYFTTGAGAAPSGFGSNTANSITNLGFRWDGTGYTGLGGAGTSTEIVGGVSANVIADAEL